MTLFEKERAVAGVTETLHADCHWFEWSTKIFPADKPEGPGILPELLGLQTEYGEEGIREYITGKSFDRSLGGLLPVPKPC